MLCCVLLQSVISPRDPIPALLLRPLPHAAGLGLWQEGKHSDITQLRGVTELTEPSECSPGGEPVLTAATFHLVPVFPRKWDSVSSCCCCVLLDAELSALCSWGARSRAGRVPFLAQIPAATTAVVTRVTSWEKFGGSHQPKRFLQFLHP